MLASSPNLRAARRRVPSLIARLIAGALLVSTLHAQDSASQPASAPALKPLTKEAVFGPGKVDFNGSVAGGMTWLGDGQSFLHRRDGKLLKVDALTDVGQPAYDADALLAALRAAGDFDEKTAERFARAPGQMSADRSVTLLESDGRLFLYNFAQRKLKRIADKGERVQVGLSPAGRYVSYVNGNDLYVIDGKHARTHRRTRDGTPTLLNGILDWVYQEEIYGRSNYRGYWWRKDDKYIAYLQLDESKVPTYTIIDKTPTHPNPEVMQYPKSGDPNPGVRVGIVKPSGFGRQWVDLSAYKQQEILVSGVSWAPDGKLILMVQDREQRWLDLLDVDPANGRARVLLKETSPAWVDNIAAPHWLDDGSFLWLSERDGWSHLYHYARDGKLNRRVTEGEWTINGLSAVDQAGGWIYFTATRDTVLENHLYRTPLSGGEIQRLTEPGFSHRVSVEPGGAFFFDTFSSAAAPQKLHLRRGDGALVRVVSENDVPARREYALGTAEFVKVPARDGHILHARLLRPADFDPSRKYPVWCEIYAGPESPTVRNTWGGIEDQYWAQQGLVVWRLDPRSAIGEGAKSSWACYQKMGQAELADIEDGVRWLIAQGWVDESRIGIHGHSYGGYISAYALTHSTLFSLGVAGAPVTDWRNYDSIYTERYMRTPANNPDGYEKGSVVNAAENLHGRLVVAHGLIDDNVHFQNTAQLIDALQAKTRQFSLMVYPRDRHGFGNGARHFQQLLHREIEQYLLRIRHVEN